MRAEDRVGIAVCAAIVAASVVHVLAPSAPIYYPLDHAWRWEKVPDGVAMHWYGRSAWSLASGALAFGLAYLVAGWVRSEPPRWLPRALAALGVGSLALALALVARHEWSLWMTR